MAIDEPKGEDIQEDTVDAATSPEAPDTSQTQEDTKELPVEYAGKTPAELVKILQDKESFITQRNDEVGQLRGKVGDLESQAAYNAQFGAREQTQPQVETPAETTQPSDDDFLTVGDLRKMNEQGYRKDMQIRGQLQMSKSFLDKARQETPDVFKGLTDQEVQGTVYQYLSSNNLDPTNLSNTRTWKMAANFIQGEKTDYTFAPTHKVAEPVEPVPTAVPSQSRPQDSEEVIPISEKDRAYAKDVLGMADATDDEIRDMIEAGIDTQRTGVKS